MDGGPDHDADPPDSTDGPGREAERSPAEDADRWVAEQRVDDAVDARRRAADLREQAAQEGTLHGVLVDLAEHRRPVVVRTVGGVEHRVGLTAIGTDVVTGRSARGEHVVIGIDAIATVRAEPGAGPSIGDRAITTTLTLVGHLQELAAVRPAVVVHLRDGAASSGMLRTAGTDVIAVRRPDGERTTVHVAVGALSDVVVLDATELP